MAFKQLEIIEPILRAVAAEGYTIPTPIQQQAIPLVLQRKDLLGCAQTGTGKTAAFAIPILQILHGQKPMAPGIKVLILTPTRELAIQIDESFAAYGKHTGLRHTVIFGGVSQLHQTNALKRGVDILVATPGRLLDLMNQGFINLKSLQIFVLDEADRMLDMGFIHDVKRVIIKLPVKRQTLFFSATMPPEIQKLAAQDMHIYDFAFDLAVANSDDDFLAFLDEYTVVFVQLRLVSSFVDEIESEIKRNHGLKLPYFQILQIASNIPSDCLKISLEVFLEKGWINSNESKAIEDYCNNAKS